MSEAVSIAVVGGLLGVLQIVICGIMAHLLARLDKLTERMQSYVTQQSCDAGMCKHSQEIDELWAVARKSERDITRLNEIAKIYHDSGVK